VVVEEAFCAVERETCDCLEEKRIVTKVPGTCLKCNLWHVRLIRRMIGQSSLKLVLADEPNS
jgi:hypothetical protein